MAGAAKALTKAFSVKSAPAVALAINSPGGSAAQSSLIGKRIRRLAEEKKKPVIAFVEDVAASGGYWLACAADEIIADESSIVGSIGVIGGGFGFPELLAKAGVERRVYTAGRSKSQLDPFRPENPEDVARFKSLLEDVHASFIGHVKSRRGAKLTPSEGMFEGEIYSARRALELGLIDGLGDLYGVVKDRYGPKAQLKLFPLARPSPLRRLFGGMGRALAEEVLDAADARAAWARVGL